MIVLKIIKVCAICGEEMDQDCQGNPRCSMCDSPCPCCSDGPGPGFDDDDDDDDDDDE